MQKIALGFLLILGSGLFICCGGGNAANNQQSANNKTNSKVEQNANTSQPSNVDATPLNLSIKDLGSADELKGYIGRTMIFKTEGLKSWDEESLTASYVSRIVVCKGDFSEYKDSIKKFQEAKDFIYADFKGVVDKVDDSGSNVTVTLKNCVVTKLDK